MELKATRFSIDGHVATVWLHRPERHNAWTGRMHTEYRWILAHLDAQRANRHVAAHEAAFGEHVRRLRDVGGGRRRRRGVRRHGDAQVARTAAADEMGQTQVVHWMTGRA